MTTHHSEGGHDHHDHAHEDHQDEHGHEHAHGTAEDWASEEFVARWIERNDERAPERRRQFVTMRAFIPMAPDQEFTYLNLGAGPGNLDEVLLEQFRGAQATLVDTSLPMLNAARKRLSRYGDRVEYIQADLSRDGWHEAVGGPFNLIVSSLTLHHLEEPPHIREALEDIYSLLGHGGVFLNFDYVRPARPTFAGLGAWAARDPEAGITGRHDDHDIPGTLSEQLGWLAEAGFANVDVVWKQLNLALTCAFRDHLHFPDSEDGHDDHGHSHAH